MVHNQCLYVEVLSPLGTVHFVPHGTIHEEGHSRRSHTETAQELKVH